MNLLLTSSWSFGMNELINSIAALLTFVAICVSLYLAQKSKTLKFKVLGKKINKKAFQENQYQQINILNNGHTKFTITSAGYLIKRRYFFTYHVAGLKKLDSTIIEQKTHGGKNHITTETVLLPTYIQEGDLLQISLFPADYDFSEIKSKRAKVYIFIIVNGKKYKYKTKLRFNEFNSIVNAFDKKSLFHPEPKLKFKSQDIKNYYFR
ncbi:MAG: hypothetical protein IKM43_00915 [Clostridia bacterium]|nr:hypothetical protein [Clostridia bacterium]